MSNFAEDLVTEVPGLFVDCERGPLSPDLCLHGHCKLPATKVFPFYIFYMDVSSHSTYYSSIVTQ